MNALTPALKPPLYSGSIDRATDRHMARSNHPQKSFRDVELVRVFLEDGHPWLAIIALTITTGSLGLVAVQALGLAKALIAHLH